MKVERMILSRNKIKLSGFVDEIEMDTIAAMLRRWDYVESVHDSPGNVLIVVCQPGRAGQIAALVAT